MGRRFIAIFILAVAATSPSHAEPLPASLRLTIHDNNDRPIEGAKVTIRPADDGNKSPAGEEKTALSDKMGLAAITLPLTDTEFEGMIHDMTITKEGSADLQTHLQVFDGAQVEETFKLNSHAAPSCMFADPKAKRWRAFGWTWAPPG